MAIPRLIAILMVLCSGLFSGCTIVPGSRLLTFDKTIVGEAEKDISEQVEIYPITFPLIQELSPPAAKPRGNPELDAAIASYDYRVGKGDILNIIVFEHEELTIPAGSYRSAADSGTWVHSDGTIYFPYVGKLRVVGLTLEEVRIKLTRELGKFIEDVNVEVNVAAFNSQRVYVTGEVRNPGIVNLSNIPLTLLDAVNLSGGLTERADWKSVILSRRGVDEVLSLEAMLQNGVLMENRLLKENDIIHVSRNDHLKVFVLGEVGRPSTLTMDRSGMKLAEALGGVGGINEESADATGVFVIRGSSPSGTSKARIYQLNLSDASAMVLGAEFDLDPYDVVYVTAAPMELWNRVVKQLLTSLQVYDSLNKNFTITTK